MSRPRSSQTRGDQSSLAGTVRARTPVRSDPSMIGAQTRSPSGAPSDHGCTLGEGAARHGPGHRLRFRHLGVGTPVGHRLEGRLGEIDQVDHDIGRLEHDGRPQHDVGNRLGSQLGRP